MKQTITLVLLGDIAAGKGTQARILAKKFRLKYVGTGVFSRKMAKVSSRFARVKKGILSPSDAIQKFLRGELAHLSPVKGVLVDGGKMPGEARLINAIFKKQGRKVLVIYLTIPRDESFKRLIGRFKKTGRHDDRPASVRNRIDYYKKIYSKTVKFWKGKKVLKTADGLGTVWQVNKRLVKVVKGCFR